MAHKTRDGAKTVTVTDLRRNASAILRAVEDGETYVVTRHGVPIARILPYSEPTDLKIERPAKRRGSIADLPRIRSSVSSEEILADLRDER